MIYDVNIAKRFVQFRKKYVGKSQADVAKVLNLQQSKISRVEAAQTDIGLSDIYPLIKHYKLNVEWLTTGLGSMQVNEPAKPSLVTDLGSLQLNMDIILKGLKMLQFNQTYISNTLEKRIDQLEAKIAKKEVLV